MITMNVSGNICADAIVRNVNGTDMLTFSVASNRRFKTKSGETKEEVTFINCQLWNRPEAAKLLFKGRAVNVSGFFNVRNHVGNDGVLRPFYSVRVSSFEVFGKGKPQPTETTGQQEPEAPQAAQPAEITTEPTEPEIIDDLPF